MQICRVTSGGIVLLKNQTSLQRIKVYARFQKDKVKQVLQAHFDNFSSVSEPVPDDPKCFGLFRNRKIIPMVRRTP
jgi:hypothetical protein